MGSRGPFRGANPINGDSYYKSFVEPLLLKLDGALHMPALHMPAHSTIMMSWPDSGFDQQHANPITMTH